MKKLFILVCVALFAGTASAQITWNMKAGVGYAHCYGSEETWQLFGRCVGKIGAGIEKPFSSNWSLMPSLEVAWKGVEYDPFFSRDKEEAFKLNLLYLQIPIMAAYRINLANRWNLTLKMGPYVAYALSGKLKDKEGDFNIFSSDGTGKRIDLGLDFGVDCEYQRYVFGVEYELGFLSMVDGGSIKNGAFYATVGYKF